ncbi:MAG: hypothetical protein ABW168_27005 [Sedimenticola sp.]
MNLRHLLLVCLIFTHQSSANELALEKLVPADTELVLLTRNLPSLLQNLADNPLRKALDRKEVWSTFATQGRLINSWHWERQIQRASGYPSDDLKMLFPGQVLLTIPKVEALFGEMPSSYALIAETGGQTQQIEDLIQHRLELEDQEIGKGSGPTLSEEEYFETALNLRRYEDGQEVIEGSGWAMVNNHLVMARPAAYLRTMVASIAQGEISDNWSEKRPFKVRNERSEPWNLLFYLQGDRVGGLLEGYFRQVLKERRIAEQALRDIEPTDIKDNEREEDDLGETQEQMDPVGQLVTSSLTTIFGDALSGVMISSYTESGQSGVDMDLFFTDDTKQGGLFSLSTPLRELPSFVPAGSREISIQSVDFQRMWDWLSQLESSPLYGIGSGDYLLYALHSAAHKMGSDAQRQLSESLGSTMLTFTLPKKRLPEEGDYTDTVEVVVQELLDTEGMKMLMAQMHQLESWKAAIEPREYLDTPLYLFMRGEGDKRAPVASYAITNGYFIYSREVTEVESLLASLNHHDRRTPIWEQPPLEQALNTLPDGYSALGFEQPDSFLKGLLSGLRMLPNARPRPQTCQVLPKLKDDTFDGYLDAVISATYLEKGHIHYRLQIQHGEDKG